MKAFFDLEKDKVYTFKLNSGEELVAKVTSVEMHLIGIDTPVSIAPTPQGMQLVPSMFTADPKQTTKLNTNNISMCSLTDEPVKLKYIEATTGIKLPEKKVILG